MTVNTTWVNPTGATLDLSNGTVVTETNWDAVASGLYRLGGTDGNAKTGPLQIGSTQTYSNAQNTAGLTINQGAADDEAIALKSSDVAHGVTAVAETDTYGRLQKQSATAGGLIVTGLSEGIIAVNPQAIQTSSDTAKTVGANAAVYVQSFLKSGTTVADIGANGNLVAFVNNATTRFILDGDGDSHQDVGTAWTNFSDHDDVGLLNIISAHVTRDSDPLKERFRDFLHERREQLEEMKLVTFNEDGHHFVNMSRLTMLLVGAAIQSGRRIAELERRLLPAG